MIEPRGWTTAAFCPMAGRGPTPEPPLPVVVVVVVAVVVVVVVDSSRSSGLLSQSRPFQDNVRLAFRERERVKEVCFNQ